MSSMIKTQSDVVRWAIIGPGIIANNFAFGLEQAPSAKLVAVGSTNLERATNFGKQYGLDASDCYGSYGEVFAREDVDAVYIATIHTTHAQLSVEALTANKHVVCEKPTGISADEVKSIIECARKQKLFFLEAYMYRFHPQISKLQELINKQTIGTISEINANFGYAAEFDPNSRIYDPQQAGGGILDIGGYPVSFSRLVAGFAENKLFADPISIKGSGRIGETGVDYQAKATLEFANSIKANVEVAIDTDFGMGAKVTGTKGQISLENPWIPGRNEPPADSTILINTDEGEERIEIKDPHMLFYFEAQAASKAILEQELEVDQMSWDDSIGNAIALDTWLHEVKVNS